MSTEQRYQKTVLLMTTSTPGQTIAGPMRSVIEIPQNLEIEELEKIDIRYRTEFNQIMGKAPAKIVSIPYDDHKPAPITSSTTVISYKQVVVSFSFNFFKLNF